MMDLENKGGGYTDYQVYRVIDAEKDIQRVVRVTLATPGGPYLVTMLDTPGGEIDGTYRYTGLTHDQAARFIAGTDDVMAFAEEL